MTLQNRVDPWGEIHAVPERGTMMGNRGGKLHRPDRTLGSRRWASHHWICCELHYRNMHHEPMGQGYTSLFFLDEVTALAAGHRPCFYCRRAEARAFLGPRKADEFDRQLHAERLQSLTLRRPAQPGLEGSTTRPEAARAAPPSPQHGGVSGLPDGTMLDIDGMAFALCASGLLRWSFAGYVESISRNAGLRGKVLTPPAITAILRGGYKPRWHESAQRWGKLT